MDMRNCLEINVTVVANEFIDRYMASANGEYVKVYLYLLRHQGEKQDIGAIADALNHTEADVRRALGYWSRQGVLGSEAYGNEGAGPAGGGSIDAGMPETYGIPGNGPAGIYSGSKAAGDPAVSSAWTAGSGGGIGAGAPGSGKAARWPGGGTASVTEDQYGLSGSGAGALFGNETGKAAGPGGVSEAGGLSGSGDRGGQTASGAAGGIGNKAVKETAAGSVVQTGEGRKMYTPEQVSRLADQEDFTQLLYIAQKYMNKVFTPRECEVFAYLYDALGMSVELLEYLVEYCVQNGHYSIRYLESVALNWHEKGIRTVNGAKEYTATFSKEGFAVMRAFGISDRRPGESEQALIRKWFKEYGFTKDIVVEACGRTLRAIHKPSFSYADKILSDWKKGGVRILADVGKMDEKRERENKKGGKNAERNTGAVKPSRNQFHNFEQRNTDYDAMVLERLKERLEEKP